MYRDGRKGEWISLMECISACGKRLPGFYIMKGKPHILGNISEGLDGNIGFAYSEKRWTDDVVSLRWLNKHFNIHARPSAAERCGLLLLDSHPSYITKQFEQYSVDHRILLVLLERHMTHLLQLLGVRVFSKFDAEVGGAQRGWHCIHRMLEILRKIDFHGISESCREFYIAPSIILASFHRAGIRPFNPRRVLKDPNIE